MIEKLRAPVMALTMLLAGTAFAATCGAAAARNASQDHKDHKVEKDRDGKRATKSQSHHRKKHEKKAVMCIKAPCPANGKDRTKPPADANKDKPVPAPVGGLRPAKGDVVVSNGVTATILHGASAGVVVQTLEPGKILVRADNGQSVTLSGGSVNVSGAKIVSPGVSIDRADHPNGEVTVAIRPGAVYAKPPASPAPAAPPPPSHVTGGPEGGFLGAIGGSIVDAGKAVGRGAEDVLSIGSPKPGTPGAGEPKTSTTTQQ
ncbi:MAG TPA: hypothetical protein VN655_10965 [Pseudolabrys sp.]|nr:hypothetical protein [Pseudolabrys sp.]